MKKRGFTDKLYFANITAVWLFVMVGIACTCLQNVLGIVDMSVFNTGIPCAFAELSVHTGYIIWKAKNENISKYGWKVEVDDEPIEYDTISGDPDTSDSVTNFD